MPHSVNQTFAIESFAIQQAHEIISDFGIGIGVEIVFHIIDHPYDLDIGTAVAGATVFAGSVTIGKFCIIGGTSVFNGHISICDQVTISGMCMVMRSIDKPGVYSSGIPAQSNREWRLTAARVLHINDMYRKVNEMERELETLKATVNAQVSHT